MRPLEIDSRPTAPESTRQTVKHLTSRKLFKIIYFQIERYSWQVLSTASDRLCNECKKGSHTAFAPTLSKRKERKKQTASEIQLKFEDGKTVTVMILPTRK